MVTQNKTWQFYKRIKNDNYNVWRKSTLLHFELGVVISELLKTPPPPPPLPLPLIEHIEFSRSFKMHQPKL